MIKRIKIPIYHGTLILIQKKKLTNIPKKYQTDFNTFGYSAITYSKTRKSGYMEFIMAFDFKNINHRIITHESLHLVNFVFDKRQIDYTTKNDEHAAYFIGWVVNECYKYLKL